MLKKADTSAIWAIVASLVLFFIGGLMTTVVPPMVDKSWGQPFANADKSKGPTGHLRRLNGLELAGRAVYVREGCWYCHTQQIRTLLADTKRYGWKGVDAPISTPDEFVYDSPHMFGTKRTGPDLARIGGRYDTQWHRTHFRNPRDLVKGSIMPAFPWLFTNKVDLTGYFAEADVIAQKAAATKDPALVEQAALAADLKAKLGPQAANLTEFDAMVAYLQTLGRAKDWREANDYEK